ncbi:Asp-tRNA(Asn)/Glu-tRNA(Gln) amidotransferase subunit GatB [Candidatus Minimicrobia vallesae]|uniref:Asp-tRNA(Asn)/Glu-tRNA(Gln) amidotransferase subunit GatB n=1 Tax=Candidatus Minimicrobia vallesae TaxID=2841264 RepID=UPI001E48B5BD|nr:Asp-tRNA(Asn)/Glu-tRNA(Gln) amidotransferase subunit GatB [Candidatus Minimicrobia vallesae]
MSVYDDYEMTIGIECHVQLATKTKLFSPADNDARDAEPNTKTHQIDFGLPGMLPVLNKHAVELAVRAGKALNSPIAHVSRFDRKHYFYPDLPKGYQTSQMYNPIILAGYVDAPLEDGSLKRVRIDHAHMEEDAGKLTHHDGYSLVDLNRAGTPLIEIVSEPDMHSAEEAKAYVSELHKLMVYAGVTYGNLYHGNMRFDVNISVAKKGATELGKRAEIKNLNSFRSVERAAEYEFKRQVDILERGEEVVQETRGWNDDKQITISQRSKEDAQDYRYMPDPDIPPVVLTDEVIAGIQSKVPMLPGEYREKWSALNLDKSVINSLLSNQDYAQITLEVQEKSGEASAKRVAHWFASALTASDNDTNDDSTQTMLYAARGS